MKSLLNLARRWKLTTQNKLINQHGDWKYQNYQWDITSATPLPPPPLPPPHATAQRYRPAGAAHGPLPPKPNLAKPVYQVGYIEVRISMPDSKIESHVLSCLGSCDVILDAKEGIHLRDALWSNQKWMCGMPDKHGWFLIQQVKRDEYGRRKFLTNDKDSGRLEVKGNSSLALNLLVQFKAFKIVTR